MQLQLNIPVQSFPQYTAGIDEAGRGPLAGPVVAAAVIFQGKSIRGLRDSKKLSEEKREQLYKKITERCIWGVGIRDHKFVDDYGIRRATHEAMKEAVGQLGLTPQLLLIDGRDNFSFTVPAHYIIGGDDKVKQISAASIIAKVTRDRLMKEYAGQYKCYGFETHKGYGTKLHLSMLKEHGVCAIHRKTYLGKILNQGASILSP